MRYRVKLYLTFESFWADYHKMSLYERRIYFESLSSRERCHLIECFFQEGWAQVVVQNIIDKRLNYVKAYHGIDLIDLRIQALKLGKVFLIDKDIWEEIEELFFEFDDYYNTNLIFGGLVVSNWGRHKKFCRIRAMRRS